MKTFFFLSEFNRTILFSYPNKDSKEVFSIMRCVITSYLIAITLIMIGYALYMCVKKNCIKILRMQGCKTEKGLVF